MRPAGYTLIELLVVIAIMSILAVGGFVNFKDFSAGQVAIKAAGQIQTYLRLAQSNATSSTTCNGQGAIMWYLVFTSATDIDLRCDTATTTNAYYKNYSLESGVQIDSITGSSCGATALSINSVIVKYAVGTGTFSFSANDSSGNPVNATCLGSSSLTFTTKYISSNSTRSFTITKGGAINVQ